jgi:ATP synthase protein I
MGAPEDRSAKLDELDRRIRAAREAQQPKRGKTGEKFAMANMAWRMTLELVVGGMVGAAMGYGLDVVFGTMPVFLIVFVLLGFAAGVRTVMRSAKELEQHQAAEAAESKAAEAAKTENGA